MRVESMEDLPVKQSQRHRTDNLCSILSGLFALVMLSVALFKYSTYNLHKMTYPTDLQGTTCGFQAPKHPYLYFTQINDPTKRLCVNQCPTEGDQHLSCKATRNLSCKRNSNPDYLVEIYDTKLQTTRMGLFCLPTSPELKERILRNSGLSGKYHFLIAYDAIHACMIAAVVLGVVYVLIVQFFNERLPRLITGLGGGLCVLLALLTLFVTNMSHPGIFKLLVGLTLLIIGGALFLLMFYCQEELRMCGIFLKNASIFISTKWTVLLLIPVFMLIGALLIGLFLFQLLAYWAAANQVFIPKQVYYDPQNNGAVFWTVLNFMQLIWFLEFLKYAFSLIISGYAINYYFKGTSNLNPIKYLFWYHWGSVVAGAFLLNFLSYPDLIFDSLMPKDQAIPSNRPVNACSKFCGYAFGWLKPLFELARSESMAYINLTGLPYCNASRYCEYINRVTDLYNGNQSVNRMYRVGAHALLAGLTVIFGLMYMLAKGNTSAWAALFIGVMSFFIVTFFISLHGDAAQALLITFLTELLLCHNQINQVAVAPSILKDNLIRQKEYAIKSAVGGSPIQPPYPSNISNQPLPQQVVTVTQSITKSSRIVPPGNLPNLSDLPNLPQFP